MTEMLTMEQEQALGQLATQMRSIAAGIVQASSGSGDGKSQQLRKLTADGLLHILRVKEAAKQVCVQTEGSKEATQAAKLSLDSSDSTLQNLLYEKSYYEKEIHSCRSFVSKYSDEEVALMPVADFLASLTDAPEDQDLRKAASTNDHELMKARLIHEDRVRKSLIKKLEELKRNKQILQEHVNQKQRTVSDLQAKLKAVESTAKPLQQVLGPSMPLKASMSRAAELLPTPLYLVYSQVVAVREALQHGCSASITGSTEQAEAYAQALADGDDSQLLLLRTSTAGATPPEEIYKPHPLSVELQVHREATLATSGKAPSVLLTVILQYLPALRVVTAHCPNAADNVLLKSLFPGDDGSGMPIECLQQLQGGSFRYSSARPARPYRWCQHLCGLDFIPTLPQLAAQLTGKDYETVVTGLDTYRRQQRVPTLIMRLRQVKLGESSLNNIYRAILQNKVPSDRPVKDSFPQSVVLVWEQQAVASHELVPATPKPAAISMPQLQQQDGTAADVGKELALVAAQHRELDDGELPAESEAGVVAGAPVEEGQQPAELGAAGMDVDGGDMDAANWGALLEEEAAARSPTPQVALAEDVRARPNDMRAQRSAAAAQLLLSDADEDTDAASVQPKVRPACNVYKVVARSRVLELEATVKVFIEYPVRPPLFRVQALRSLPPAAAEAHAATSKGGSSALRAFLAIPAGDTLGDEAANSIAWLEHQVNVHILGLLPPKKVADMLLYQVAHMRMCLDDLSKQRELNGYVKLGAATKSADVADVALLHARQQLVGKMRVPLGIEQAFVARV